MSKENPNLFESAVAVIGSVGAKFGYIFKPEIMQKIEKPFEPIQTKKETTEFGSPGEVRDADVITSSSYFLTKFVDSKDDITMINELVIKYRKSASLSYVREAIEEIVNESIVQDDEGDDCVSISFNDRADKLPDSLKAKMKEEFANLLDIMNFDDEGDELFTQWYIDGRLFLQIVIDPKNTKQGILKIKPMSPLFLKRFYDKDKRDYYYIYDTKDLGDEYGRPVFGKIPDELVVYVTSGLYEGERRISISWLHPALRDINRLDIIEDHMLIYRIVRSPERRVFYIDVGAMPPKQAEMYMNKVINSYKQKKVLDDTTGFLSPKTKHASILEDFFLMRRGDDKGTKIEQLQSVGGLDEIKDLTYFMKKAYSALRIPSARMSFYGDKEERGTINVTANEITRDEIKFYRFIRKLQLKFSKMFMMLLRKQLILKNLIKPDEWNRIRRKIEFHWKTDAMFIEAKRLANINNRLNALRDIKEHEGVYFSRAYIRKKVLNFTEQEVEEMENEMESEKAERGLDEPEQQKLGM